MSNDKKEKSTILVYKKGVRKDFGNVTGKNLSWNLFLTMS